MAMTSENHPKYRFDRMEVAGSLGDLGTLLPLAIGMILLNKLHATNVFVLIGLFYIVAGHYFGVPVPVQPMKVIGAYAIATGLTSTQIVASSLWMGIIILFLGTTGLNSGDRQVYAEEHGARGAIGGGCGSDDQGAEAHDLAGPQPGSSGHRSCQHEHTLGCRGSCFNLPFAGQQEASGSFSSHFPGDFAWSFHRKATGCSVIQLVHPLPQTDSLRLAICGGVSLGASHPGLTPDSNDHRQCNHFQYRYNA